MMESRCDIPAPREFVHQIIVQPAQALHLARPILFLDFDQGEAENLRRVHAAPSPTRRIPGRGADKRRIRPLDLALDAHEERRIAEHEIRHVALAVSRFLTFPRLRQRPRLALGRRVQKRLQVRIETGLGR
jgi:hypothetical protein